MVKVSFVAWVNEQLRSDPDLSAQVAKGLKRLDVRKQLQTLRQQRSVSQDELAKCLGISQPAVAKLERDAIADVKLGTLFKFVTVLGGSINLSITADPTLTAEEVKRAVQTAALTVGSARAHSTTPKRSKAWGEAIQARECDLERKIARRAELQGNGNTTTLCAWPPRLPPIRSVKACE